jgi:hypothetical protein
VCSPYATKSAQIDGVDGRDNAWGSLFVPLIEIAASDPTPSITETNFIRSGSTTLLLRVTGLSDDLNQTAIALKASVATGAPIPSPTFATTTTWPAVQGSNATFSEVYVTNGLIVARSPDAPLTITVHFLTGIDLPIRIHNGIMTFRRSEPSGVDGTIGGTLTTTEVTDTLRSIAGRMSRAFCGSASDGVVNQVRAMQDILVDATNAPSVPCTAISIGLKFTAKQISNDQTSVDVASPPDPCAADAGTD